MKLGQIGAVGAFICFLAATTELGCARSDFARFKNDHTVALLASAITIQKRNANMEPCTVECSTGSDRLELHYILHGRELATDSIQLSGPTADGAAIQRAMAEVQKGIRPDELDAVTRLLREARVVDWESRDAGKRVVLGIWDRDTQKTGSLSIVRLLKEQSAVRVEVVFGK